MASDLATPCELSDLVGGPKRERLYGHRRLAAPRGYETASITEEEVADIVRAMITVDDRAVGIIAHATGTHQVHGKVLFSDRPTQYLQSSCRFRNLRATIL